MPVIHSGAHYPDLPVTAFCPAIEEMGAEVDYTPPGDIIAVIKGSAWTMVSITQGMVLGGSSFHACQALGLQVEDLFVIAQKKAPKSSSAKSTPEDPTPEP